MFRLPLSTDMRAAGSISSTFRLSLSSRSSCAPSPVRACSTLNIARRQMRFCFRRSSVNRSWVPPRRSLRSLWQALCTSLCSRSCSECRSYSSEQRARASLQLRELCNTYDLSLGAAVLALCVVGYLVMLGLLRDHPAALL